MIVHSGSRPALAGRRRPESGRPLDRLLRRRQADALQPPAAQRVEPLQRQREMRAALVRRDRVDLVDDDGLRGRQHAAARIRSRAGCRAIPASSRGCAAAGGACGRARPTACRRCAPSCGSRLRAGPAPAMPRGCRRAGASRFLLDVVRQRLQRRDIDDLRLVRQRRDLRCPWRTSASIAARNAASVLPGAGRRRDQHMPPVLDRRPGFLLRRGRRAEAAGEPVGDGGVKQGSDCHALY